jgi:hypothetical protein
MIYPVHGTYSSEIINYIIIFIFSVERQVLPGSMDMGSSWSERSTARSTEKMTIMDEDEDEDEPGKLMDDEDEDEPGKLMDDEDEDEPGMLMDDEDDEDELIISTQEKPNNNKGFAFIITIYYLKILISH